MLENERWFSINDTLPADGQIVVGKTLLGRSSFAIYRTAPAPHWDCGYGERPLQSFPYWIPAELLLREFGLTAKKGRRKPARRADASGAPQDQGNGGTRTGPSQDGDSPDGRARAK